MSIHKDAFETVKALLDAKPGQQYTARQVSIFTKITESTALRALDALSMRPGYRAYWTQPRKFRRLTDEEIAHDAWTAERRAKVQRAHDRLEVLGLRFEIGASGRWCNVNPDDLEKLIDCYEKHGGLK